MTATRLKNAGNVNTTEGTFAQNSAIANGTFADSIWAKADTITSLRIVLKNATSDTVKADQVFVLTSEWQRFQISGTTDGGTAGFRAEFTTNGVAGNIFVWNPQVEVGTFASDPIITSGSTVTRAIETARFSPLVEAILARPAHVNGWVHE